ncbi:hypothetical protein ROJ8625_00631 [Roseivivax jejudonensis]|uniref:Leucine-binding protein domain-containing protein n=1 Tax=Roseivivax jejudonensis TaxID=1529041 RepID=A0A1X6YE54_9RHOB|nr:ABC transporter substrate-binding protein [Roseivivax jejudonensis]SLN18500.1 hypothetical protein ROJ8625_00631 [Roseivivax jejudonensis]
MRKSFTLCVAAVMWCGTVATTAAEVNVEIHYLRQVTPTPPTLSNLDPLPEDLGRAGAEVGLADNRTTGGFLGQTWGMTVTEVPEDGDFAAAAAEALGQTDLLVLDAPRDAILAAADLPEAQDALLFNATEEDTTLRGAACRANLLHTSASYAMRTDALMQMLVERRWRDLALVTGPQPEDAAFAEALESSATKFGLEIGSRAEWRFDADMRRNAAAEVPLFTQDLGEYDVLLVADEIGDFARYIPYNTWIPRPIAGSEGLVPATWAPVVEQWGAAQLQSRFTDAAGRDMRPADYGAWAAIRSIGEAVTRTEAADAPTLRAFLLGPDFELAGFKGSPLTFRDWNGQMRQPIPLVHARALAAQAPLEGFLHQLNPLDSLGLDAPEAGCTAFDAS